MVYGKFKGQDFKALKAECARNGKLFEDPEFPADDKSLYYSKASPFKAVWKRPKEIAENASMFIEGASSADVTQGRVGNCWFVAAAASVALEKSLWTKVIPDYKTDSFSPDDPADYQGIFRFRFWRFGEWIEVVVDDRLPTLNGELIFIKSKDRGEFWSALFEKAYAKMAGSYEALESGNPADALVDFTGGVSETVDLLRHDYANNLEKRKALHLKLKKLMTRKTMCSASIKVTNKSEMEAQLDTGLIKGHAYGISAVKTIKLGGGFFSKFNAEKLYMVKLRNPWGQKEWNGAWSDGSEEWNRLSQEDKEELDIHVEDDGEFWMSWDDFCSHFTTVTICVLVNTSIFSVDTTYDEGELKGKWEKGNNAGGCINNKESFILNPQYMFDIKGNEKDIAFVSLMQPDTRMKKVTGKGNLTLGFYVMKVELNRTYKCHRVYDKAGASTFVNAREVFERLELDPGRYVIVPSTFAPEVEGEFLIRVYTDNENNMKELALHEPETSIFSCLPFVKYPTHQMSCIVTEVTGLQKKGASLSVDAYCIIQCEGTKVETSVQKDNLSPKFNEGGLFYIKEIETAVLKIQVYDHNTLVPDTFLGEYETPVQVNNKVQLFTQKLFISKNKDGTITKADGTIAFKFACGDNLTLM